MPDPVNKHNSSITALSGIQTFDTLIPPKVPDATDIARGLGAAAMIESSAVEILQGIKLPKKLADVAPIIPTLGSVVSSEDLGLFQGGKLGWSYNVATNKGKVVLGFQNVLEGKHLTLTSDLRAWNDFDATGNQAAGGFLLKGNGPLEAKVGIVFGIGHENQFSVDSTVLERFNARYSSTSGWTLSAENNLSFLKIDGLKLNLYWNSGKDENRKSLGAVLGVIK